MHKTIITLLSCKNCSWINTRAVAAAVTAVSVLVFEELQAAERTNNIAEQSRAGHTGWSVLCVLFIASVNCIWKVARTTLGYRSWFEAKYSHNDLVYGYSLSTGI